MKKKRFILVLALALLVGTVLFFSSPKRRAELYFYRHQSELEASVACWQEGATLSHDPKLTANVWDGEHDIVEYIVVTRGIVPSSAYYGFFYSPDDVPVSFQNSGEELTRRGQYEWTWQGEGDDHGYIELIQPNWYYFEASL